MAVVLITGGTGYMGRALIPELVRRGHIVRALVRPGSESRLAAGAKPISGDPLDAGSVRAALADSDTLVHLVGVAHPSPAKAREFREIDLASARAAVEAATGRVSHFIYVSVAHPAPVMKEYIAARLEGEALLRASGMAATILRPWYVLGPGHWWPVVLLPVYWILEKFPRTRDSALRLGLVWRSQMITALAWAVDSPAAGIRVVEAREIRGNPLLGRPDSR
jgi:uncharacterized protein YbjT (DUF2867 family)